MIGHSLGGSVLLKYFSEELLTIKINGLFLVAPPFWGIDQDWQGEDFILHDQFDHHLKDISNLYIYHSRNENTVPFSHHIAYAEKLPHGIRRGLEGTEHLFKNGIPELISDIKRTVSE